jgi:hypothetical protein
MTQAPSIKEALELARSVMLADRDLYEVGHSERLRYDEAIRNIEAALATFQPSGERREAIARLRGRALFLRNRGEIKSPDLMEQAAALLASGLVQDEAGITPDERFSPRMLILDDIHAVCVGGRWDGWKFYKHPDGQWVSIEKLKVEEPFKGVD